MSMDLSAADTRAVAHRGSALFDQAPVALFEEDWSALRTWLHDERVNGMVDITQHLTDPAVCRRAISRIEIKAANAAAVDLLQVPDESVLLGPPSDFMMQPESLEGWRKQILAFDRQDAAFDFELSGRDAVGNRKRFGVRWVVGTQSTGPSSMDEMVVALVDLTEQWEARRALTERLRTKDGFLATVAHEMRTPLTAVVGFAAELDAGWARLGEAERRECVEIIRRESGDLSMLVDDLLVLAPSGPEGLPVVTEPVDLARAVREIAVLFAFREDQRLSLNLDPAVASGDVLRVRQILRNLLSNATRYGGVQVVVSTFAVCGRSSVTVADDGVGIPGPDPEQAFDPHVSFASEGSSRHLGVGLAVSRRLARAMGGDLVYSREDRWSIFRLDLAVFNGVAGTTAQHATGAHRAVREA